LVLPWNRQERREGVMEKSQQVLLILPGNESAGEKLLARLPWRRGGVETRRFPDGESYVRLLDSVEGASVYLYCSLDRPDEKILSLLWLASAARELGAKRVCLLAPYLAYMRQDTRFKEGEGVAARYFANLLSQHFDSLLTVDPHLHRYHSLDEIYRIPSQVVSATETIADWIKANVAQPFLVGPDEESEQWVRQVAKLADIPYGVAVKRRQGDRHVEIEMPQFARSEQGTPVLLDDIISTGSTMIRSLELLRSSFSRAPVCLGVHAIFAGEAYAELKKAGAGRIATCNTIEHPSNCIDLSPALARSLLSLD